jgi:hypothetical protein
MQFGSGKVHLLSEKYAENSLDLIQAVLSDTSSL